MKNLFLASAVALASLLAVSAPSEAAPMHHRHHGNHHHHRNCHMKTVKHREHGHWVVRKVRVCR
ncbi:hypothetical protein GR212_08050 [Rhizobium lusitanum]|uniref:Uncharacterized protein n=1 Tax=Rhizobium lusitanum TaxID=293958 RepID=A0A6L9U1W0_9HYPH|nr:hypothetical protein [Rhizobium lusitanum]NEI69521.1 hypothetical protein [Rhizobium lusitanum]